MSLGNHNERGFPGPYGSDPLGLYGGIDLVSRGTNNLTGVRASATLGAGRSYRTRIAVRADRRARRVPERRLLRSFGDRHEPHRHRPDHRPLSSSTWSAGRSGCRPAGRFCPNRRRTGSFATSTRRRSRSNDPSTDGLSNRAGRSSAAARSPRAFALERIQRSTLAAGEFGRPAFDDDVVWSVNPKISGSWFVRPCRRATGWTKIRFGAGTGIKPPTAFEIAFTDNPA